MTSWQLAQLNVARLRHPLDDVRTAGFVEALDPINELAETSPGFVWRLVDDEGQSSSYVELPGERGTDPLFLVNLSVWETPDQLRDFVYGTVHRDYLRQRADWFEPFAGIYAVCWWVPAGHEPTATEALDRLDRLERDGPTAEVFPFRPPFPPPPDP
jgi:hypothetical protein